MMNGMMSGMGMMVWGVVSFLLGLPLIFLFVVAAAAVKWLWGQGMPFVIREKKSALDILRMGYARGDIDKQQFERLKKDIE